MQHSKQKKKHPIKVTTRKSYGTITLFSSAATQLFNKNYSFFSCKMYLFRSLLFTNHIVTAITFLSKQHAMSSKQQSKKISNKKFNSYCYFWNEKICISMTILLNFQNQRHFECPLMTFVRQCYVVHGNNTQIYMQTTPESSRCVRERKFPLKCTWKWHF